MILCKEKILVRPTDLYLPTFKDHFGKYSLLDKDYFQIPNYLKSQKLAEFSDHQKCLIYKIGFLTEYLRILYPSRNKDFVYQMVLFKYQVFVSKRNFTQYLTHWNKYRNQILDVPNND